MGVDPTVSQREIGSATQKSKGTCGLVSIVSCTTSPINRFAALFTFSTLLQILLIHHKLPSLRTIVQYTGLPPLSDQRRLHKSHGKHILSWDELNEIGKALPDNKIGANSVVL